MSYEKIGSAPRPWVVISDYPSWSSPYFAELERYAPPDLHLTFSGGLDLSAFPGPPGVINLHRLKRLYQSTDGRRTRVAADAMLRRLAELRTAGWKMVWTVHNLMPIDGASSCSPDRYVTDGVLALADAVLTHTHTDARHLRSLTRAPVTVTGWGAPTPDPGPPPASVDALAHRMAAAPFAVLVLGNITAYKNLPAVMDDFVAATRRAELFVVGPSRDQELVDDLARRAAAAGGRGPLQPERIPAGHIHRLYRGADVALCPYRADGPWQFFADVLHPSSVGTALSYDTPVIAPDLPAIREMTAGRPARLYTTAAGLAAALSAAENLPRNPAQRFPADPAKRWRSIGAVYAQMARTTDLAQQRRTDNPNILDPRSTR